MALDHKFSNTGTASVYELLHSNEQFMVPRFQRNYSWNRDKVEQLWVDLEDNYQKIRDNSELTHEIQYLLGPVVLVRNDTGSGKYWIIDGQQRLSTLTMIFCVARDIIRENNLKAELGEINNMIEITSIGRHIGWKLILNDTDKVLFREIQEFENKEKPQIERIKELKKDTKSAKKLIENYIFLYDKIVESLCTDFGRSDIKTTDLKNMSDEEKRKHMNDNITWLNYFLMHIRENNYLVKIMVNDDATAFQIFETLNNRGQTLSRSNLIKNHVLNQIKGDERQSELSYQWNDIFDRIIGTNQDDDEFILESFRSRYPNTKISKKDLYTIIKNELKLVNNEKSCIQYIKDLERDAEFVEMINDSSTYPDIDTRDEIRAVDILGAKFIRIPMLAAWRRWGMGKEYKDLVKFLVKFFFKYRVIRQMHPGSVDYVISEITTGILENKNLDDIIKHALKHDDHDDFNYNFRRYIKAPKTGVAKYILQKITLHLGTPDNDVRPIDDLTLEHILPKKHTETWPEKDFLHDKQLRMDEFVGRLGNLTLLTLTKNIANKKSEIK